MDKEKQKPVKTVYRITNKGALILGASAFVFDAATAIPFVGDVAGPVFWIGASIYFYKSGLGLVNGRRLAITMISGIMELIPAIQELPTILAGTILIILSTRAEDRLGISLNPLKENGVTQIRNRITPYNIKPGIRGPNKDRKYPDQTTPDSEQIEKNNTAKNNTQNIDSLTADKEQWERELQGLEPQLNDLNTRYKEDSVQYLKLQMAVTEKLKQGADKEEVEEARKIASDFSSSTRRNDEMMHRMQEKVDVLKNQIWSTNNKITEETIRTKGYKLN